MWDKKYCSIFLDGGIEMNIQDKEYEILDVLSEITIVNTSVCSKHKRSSSSHGERKIYLPGSIEEKNRFFDNFEGDIEGFFAALF